MEDKSAKDWAFPLIFGMLFGMAALYADYELRLTVWIVAGLVVVGGVLLAVAIANLGQYLSEQRAYQLMQRQSALSITPDGQMFREARQLAADCPELAGEIAKRLGRPDLVLFPTRQGKQSLIRLAGSQVTLQFALWVLQMSDEKTMVAQRKVNDGTYIFDPNREISDRGQWVELNHLWARENMVTRYVPGINTNMPPMWLQPWNPQRILDNWLLSEEMIRTLRPYLFPTEETVDENEAEEQQPVVG